MAYLNHDPIACLLKSFNSFFPGDRTEIVLVNSDDPYYKKHFFKKGLLKNWKRQCWAFWSPNNPKYIFVDVYAPYYAIIELIAHELAHVITYGKEKDDHGEIFKSVHDGIMATYMELAKKEVGR